jgi:glycine betaine/proline transport system permease protein
MDLKHESPAALLPEDGGNDTAQRREQIARFVRTNPGYYAVQFEKIGSQARFVWTFNVWAGLLGPIWYSARGLWNWGLAFLIIETFAFVQIVRGLFGDLAAAAWKRIAQIEGTLELRKQQLAAALESNSDKVDVYKRTVESLESAIGGIHLEARQLEESGLYIAIGGFVLLVMVKICQTVYANKALERRFSEWLSDPNISSGMPAKNIVLSVVFVCVIIVATILHYSFPGAYPLLMDFPTHAEIRLTTIKWVENFLTLPSPAGRPFSMSSPSVSA